jgi:hypothetical protein
MDKEICLVISRCEDEPTLQLMTQDEVMAALNDDWQNYKTIAEEQIREHRYSFLEHFPDRSVLIMRGKLGKKKAVQQVIKWELE